MQNHKGILVLHHIRMEAVLDGLIDKPAFNVSSIDKIVFVIPVSAVNHRFSNIAGKGEIFSLVVYL